MLVLNNNLWLISIRQSFLNLLPYFIIIGFSILSFQLLEILNYKDNIIYEINNKIINLFSFATPLVISTAVSYYLAKNFDLNRTAVTTVGFLLFIYFYWEYKDIDLININLKLNFLMIIMPILTVFLYRKIFELFNKIIRVDDLNDELENVLKSIIPFLITFILSALIIIIFIKTTSYLSTLNFFEVLKNLPIELLSILNLVASGLIWWTTGIHGTNLVISVFGEDYLKQEIVGNIDADILINNFVIYGGDGSTLALILAIIFFVKHDFLRKIALITLPFSIFNINEIVLFALPVILNIRLLLPFLLAPLSNFFIAYIFFYFFPVNHAISISWITPVFISGYIVDNNFTYLFLQIIQLSIAILIYLPFVKNYKNYLEENKSFENLKNSLGIKEHFEKTMHLHSIKSQQDIINEEKETAKLVKELSEGEFLLYYQPKIDVKNLNVRSYEALLRFKKSDGTIVGPYFIDKIEQIGFERIIDIWVINQLKKDLLIWKEKDFRPRISINISPESICNEQIVQKIIDEFKGFKIGVEILERTFAKEMKQFISNIERLRKNGIKISIDDFGSGFSSLQYLNILPVDFIKLDRSLILNTKTKSGEVLYKNIAIMCKNQDFEIIAEGIETEKEMEIIKDSDISIVQGFYFSKAIPASDLQDYEKSFEKDKK